LGPGRMIKRWLRPRNGGGGIWRRRQGRISVFLYKHIRTLMTIYAGEAPFHWTFIDLTPSQNQLRTH
jgi:hypothetical protein